MNPKELDVVYSVKEGRYNEELRYSLRSLKNLEHKNTWVFGGVPDWVNQDIVKVVKTDQNTGNKWKNTALGLKAICENPEVSENFIWFNDDFFIMKKTSRIGFYYDRTLDARINDFSTLNTEKVNPYSWWGRANPYVQRLHRALYVLNREKLGRLNFELHIPMVFNRKQLLEIINKYPDVGAKRTLYGNTFIDPSLVEQTDDVKIWSKTKLPELGRGKLPFISTDDRSFADGEIGKLIREKFKKPSVYEKG